MVGKVDTYGRVTRRELLLTGLTSALVCTVVPLSAWSAAMPRVSSPEEWTSAADLYAFTSPSGSSSVLAFTWAASLNPIESVCIHADDHAWTFHFSSMGTLEQLTSRGSQASCSFAGPLRNGAANSSRLGAVLEVPNAMLAAKSEIWGEQLFRNGVRRRVGSPLVAAVISRHEQLERVYHSLSPDRDVHVRKLFAQAVTSQAIAAGTISEPKIHGTRLANLLLPDVLHYSAHAPSGFTFAARNGRHPEEADARVVHSMLYGVKPRAERRGASAPLKSIFPYFQVLPSVPA